MRSILFAGGAVFLGLAIRFAWTTMARNNVSSFSSITAALTQKENSSAPADKPEIALPVRLKIPRINVDAAVEYVGLTTDGAMSVPAGPSDVAWFSLGPRPGEIGSAVIAGHYGWKNNIPAAFDEVSRLRKGDRIEVEDGKGALIVFIVREIRNYGETDNAVDIFSSTDGKAHLNLVTCKGIWSSFLKSYSQRLIVFADKE